ncbi:IS1182 family transposase [Chloroflexota bacterium]
MSLPTRTIAPVSEETAEVARAAFPKGNKYMQMRDELGTIYSDDVFADLYPKEGQPAVRPWRLALVTVMQFAENLSDRQAADAVRDRIAWKYALSLELTDAGFDYSVLSEFRQRLLTHDAGQRLLDEMLKVFKTKSYVKARGQQRTDSTHVLAVVRELSRLENVGTTLRHALNTLAEVVPEWLAAQVSPDWYDRYGPRFEHYRLPKRRSEQIELAEIVGQDGVHLLTAVQLATDKLWLREIPAVETLRQVWIQQFWCDDGQVYWRDVQDMPPVGAWIRSPFDTEARYCTKRQAGWVGYKVHLTETCTADEPSIITQVTTTVATVQDCQTTTEIQDQLAAADLLPSEQLVDAGYVDAERLLSSQNKHAIDLIGPTGQDTSWQAQTEGGLSQTCFAIDWDKQQAVCPAGQSSVAWHHSRSPRDTPVIRISFAAEHCQNCELRSRCTKGKKRGLTLRPREQHEVLQAARQREQTDTFKKKYRKRAGVEGAISQAERIGGLRRSRYCGLEKTHLQNVAIAAAINLSRLINWLNEVPPAPTRKLRFAKLAA